jgi:hypothetical protein
MPGIAAEAANSLGGADIPKEDVSIPSNGRKSSIISV